MESHEKLATLPSKRLLSSARFHADQALYCIEKAFIGAPFCRESHERVAAEHARCAARYAIVLLDRPAVVLS